MLKGRFISCLLIWLFAFVAIAPSQTETAVISGRVTDPSGSVVKDADITLTNIDSNATTRVTTNDRGIYVLSNVSPGTYRITVEGTGFRRIVESGLIVHVQDTIVRNYALAVGSVSETVTVVADGMNINTSDGSVSTVVDQTYVKNMPLNGRSFQDLILLTPGVVTQSAQGNLGGSPVLGSNGEFSVNGQRPEENYYTVDGVSGNIGGSPGIDMVIGAGASGSVAASTALGTTQALVSVDELQEFRVQSSTYSAQYGRNPGGQFAFETKSGTNQWHGTAYDYLRNGYFDAADWFNDLFGVNQPALRQNDFGGTLGGPLTIPHVYGGKDRTFFFVNYEGLRLAAPQAAALNYVPDAGMRSSAPAPLQQALNTFPLPNGPEVFLPCDPLNDPNCPSSGQEPTGLAEFVASWTNPSSINSTSVRFDHVIKDRSRLFFRFSNTGSEVVARGGGLLGSSPSMNDTTAFTTRTYTGGVTSLISNRVSNEFRLNYSSNDTREHIAMDRFGGAVPADLAQLAGSTDQAIVGMSIYVGPYVPTTFQSHQSATQRQWNFVDTVNLSLGTHQLKFGVDYRRLTPFFVPNNPSVGYSFNGESDTQANNASVFVSAEADGHPLYKNLSLFAQDQWKASRRLTLSLGLRWELNPAPTVTGGPQPYTVAFTPDPNTWGLAPLGTPLWRMTWYDFAPRLGAAYVIRDQQGWETVVRGGAGIFFDSGQQLGSLGMFASPGFFASTFGSGSFGGPVSVPSVNPPQLGNSVTAFWPHLQLPYTPEWNASVEQALGKSQTITASYVGSHGARLLKQDQYITFGNPNAFLFNVIVNGLTSDYDSAQMQYQRRLSRGLAVLASYTWSHCLDYNSQNYEFGYQRGNCDFDVRHNLSSAFSYDVPNIGTNGVANAALRHWGLDGRFTARTGFPVTLYGNEQLDPSNGKLAFSGVDLISNVPIDVTQCQDPRVSGSVLLMPCPGGRGINPKAFKDPAGPVGTAPRNFVRGLGAWQMDLAVRREFPIYDRLKLQFRAEAFNVFNHPNFGFIHTNVDSNVFGEAASTLANSLGVVSPIYQMGGARSMQFALKAIF